MFNFFKKDNEEKKVSNYPEIVEQIHNEFFTAGDNILEEAKQLLSSLETKDLAKGERLAAIGFGKTKEAVVAIETKNKLASTKEIADLVVYYKNNYPFNKFITEDQVKLICEKYGLVLGDTIAYKGFVPENKLSIIERFKLKSGDGTRHYEYGSINKTLDKWSITNGEYFVKNYILKDARLSIATEPFKICAPLKDMEVGTRKQVVDYKIQDIPDPVVLQPVNGGYLIVCAWGDEASDPIVVNEVNN